MHTVGYNVAKKLNIPYANFLMETDTNDNNLSGRFDNCDFILYAHNTDGVKKAISQINKRSYFYPYGVGVNEFSILQK